MAKVRNLLELIGADHLSDGDLLEIAEDHRPTPEEVEHLVQGIADLHNISFERAWYIFVRIMNVLGKEAANG